MSEITESHVVAAASASVCFGAVIKASTILISSVTNSEIGTSVLERSSLICAVFNHIATDLLETGARINTNIERSRIVSFNGLNDLKESSSDFKGRCVVCDD